MLGKHSGRHAVQRRCEQIGYTLDRPSLDQVYRAVIAHADREKIVSDRDLAVIVARALGTQAPATDAPTTTFAPSPAADFTRRRPKWDTDTASEAPLRGSLAVPPAQTPSASRHCLPFGFPVCSALCVRTCGALQW